MVNRASSRSVLFLLCGIGLGAVARASDYYVDVVHGDNAASGTSPAQAWRNVSWATAHVAAYGGHVIRVAPGVYDAAHGESFPIQLASGVRVVGELGSELTILDGSGSAVLARTSQRGTLEGVTLRNGTYGVAVDTPWDQVFDRALTLRDVVIHSMRGAGVVGVYEFFPPFPIPGVGGSIAVELERVRMRRCNGFVELSSNSDWGDLTLRATDCRFTSSRSWGIRLRRTGFKMDALLELTRCRIADCAAGGVFAECGDGYSLPVRISDCAIVANGGDGFSGVGGGANAPSVSCVRSTIAHNAGAGLRVEPGTMWTAGVGDSIVFGNGDDLSVPAGRLFGAFSDVGDGDLVGTGVIQADPRFVSPPRGDYRLAWGSPCIDAADSSAPTGTLDLERTLRAVDGDLDALERPDMGSTEFLPLALRGTPHAGSVVALELSGPLGAPAELHLARAPLAVPPAVTPFGELDLAPGARVLFLRTHAAYDPPTSIALRVPGGGGFLGRPFALQALVDSAAAPSGRAWTNALVVTPQL